MRAVFDHHQVVFLGQGPHRVHVGHVHGEVHGQKGARARRDRGRRGRHVDAVGAGVHVHEHGHAPQAQHGHGAGLEGVGGKDHLVARTQARGLQGHLDRDGAVGHGQGVFRVVHRGEALGEGKGAAVRERVPAPVAGGQHVEQLHPLGLAVFGPRSEGPGTHRRAAREGEALHQAVVSANGQPFIRHDHTKKAATPAKRVERPMAITVRPEVPKRKSQPRRATRLGSG